ncbi:MAG: ferrous iron transport protein B [Bacteroidia bacterium]|nr:MAG: ferrous iron transport protein B [Bacteroidia bacterium]
MYLSELTNTQEAVIVRIKGHGAFRKRITEMGFIKGETVKVIKAAPLRDPIEYLVMGYHVSLRRSEARLIEVVSPENAKDYFEEPSGSLTELVAPKTSTRIKSKVIHLALAGNPNCGKTTLFNKVTGATEHVGNYSGVTVDAKKASRKYKGYTFEITDLPGTYSLSPYTPEELFARTHILEHAPDIVLNIIDAGNIERNLYLTTRLIDMNVKTVIALNMYDELERTNTQFNHEKVAAMIGIPMVPTVASSGRGLDDLFDKIIEVYEDKDPQVRDVNINYGADMEPLIQTLQNDIKSLPPTVTLNKISPRFMALGLLEKDAEIYKQIRQIPGGDMLEEKSQKLIKKIESYQQEDAETLLTDLRYGFIRGALKNTLKKGKTNQKSITEKIDYILTNKLLGIPIFLFFIWLMFQATFTLGSYPMDWIDQGVEYLNTLLTDYMQEGMLKDLITDGIIGGVGGVIIFLPNILILFFIISLMEDTGYMARAAFITDKVMHKIGLHGKSFIPLIMGFGCNVPAMMSTRTLESRNDRLLTMLINPFMSCSARLPVYLVIVGAVFPEYAGTVLFAVYGFGILMSVVIGKLFKVLFFKSEEAPFVMELPPYRRPVLAVSLRHMWSKGSQYLKKMGGIILVASILIWALGYFPQSSSETEAVDQRIASLREESQGENDDPQYSAQLNELELERNAILQKNSYIGRIGHAIEPLIRPLGFDWKMGVGIVTGIAAKEIVVSTMGVLYKAAGSDEDSEEAAMQQAVRTEVYTSGKHKGKRVFTPLTAISFLVFVLIYFPCIAVVAAVKKESGSWKWAGFLVAYTTILAWIMSFLIYQIGSFFV